MFRERAFILTGQWQQNVWLLRRHRVRTGAPVSVEMDWNWALRREESHGDVMGFGHTHPPRAGVVPSLRDVRTMRAWCLAFGKPLLCLIQCEERVQSTLFCDDDDEGRALPLTQIFSRGIIVVVDQVGICGESVGEEYRGDKFTRSFISR